MSHISQAKSSLIKSWAIFIQERFSPLAHLVMIIPLFLANGIVAERATWNIVDLAPLILSAITTIFIFFRLRIFDEIKDYQTDLSKHPERPLARGLISVCDAKRMAFTLIILEGVMAFVIGLPAFCAWLLVLLFSLCMYKEFFIGDWLRPKMELYAITHTLCSVWIGFFIASACNRDFFWTFPLTLILYGFSNWAVFNVYEFARKTYGSDEEPSHGDSYSKRLGPCGAIILLLSQLMIACGIGGYVLNQLSFPFSKLLPIGWFIGLFSIFFLLSIIYSIMPKQPYSRIYRNGLHLFIVLYYLITLVCLWF